MSSKEKYFILVGPQEPLDENTATVGEKNSQMWWNLYGGWFSQILVKEVKDPRAVSRPESIAVEILMSPMTTNPMLTHKRLLIPRSFVKEVDEKEVKVI